MSSLQDWTLHVDPGVLKTLKKIPAPHAKKLLEAICLLPNDPYFGDMQKMKGETDTWRRRIGSYRLFYKLKHTERTVLVFRLERRTSKTY